MTKIIRKYKAMSNVGKATIWFLICAIIQKGIAFLTTPIFTRLMSTEQYGEYSLYNTWFQILLMICSFRLDYAVFNKGMSKYEDKKSEYTLSMQTTTSIITVFLLFIYLIFKEKINEFTSLSTNLTLLLFLNVFFMNAISFWSIEKRYEYKYKSVVLVTILLSIISTIMGVLVVINTELKGIGRILSIAITQIIIGIIIYIYNIKCGKKMIGREYVKFALVFNLPLIPHYLSIYILEQSDKIMIQKMVGTSALGIYSVVYSIGNTINIVTNSLNQAIIPWLYESLKKKKFEDLSRKLTEIFFIGVLIVFLFVLILPEGLKILATNEYFEAINVSSAIAISTIFVLIYGIYATIEFYYDKNKFSMIASSIAAGLNIVMNYIGIKLWGYQAAGYATMLCYLILMIIHVVYTNSVTMKEYKIKIIEDKKIILLIVILLTLALVCPFLYKNNIIRYIFIIICILIIIAKRKTIKNYKK